jgi:hypothetical protein
VGAKYVLPQIPKRNDIAITERFILADPPDTFAGNSGHRAELHCSIPIAVVNGANERATAKFFAAVMAIGEPQRRALGDRRNLGEMHSLSLTSAEQRRDAEGANLTETSDPRGLVIQINIINLVMLVVFSARSRRW